MYSHPDEGLKNNAQHNDHLQRGKYCNSPSQNFQFLQQCKPFHIDNQIIM